MGTIVDLRAAGYSAVLLKKTGYSCGDMLKAGYTFALLKEAGYTDRMLKKAGRQHSARNNLSRDKLDASKPFKTRGLCACLADVCLVSSLVYVLFSIVLV